MDTFIAGEVVWPPGWTKLHVYFIPDLDKIRHLVDIYRSVIETFPFIAPVPDQWLHATVLIYSCQANRLVKQNVAV